MLTIDRTFEPVWHSKRRSAMFVAREDRTRVNCPVPYEALSDVFGVNTEDEAMQKFLEHRDAIEGVAIARIEAGNLSEPAVRDRPAVVILSHHELR